jgi:hypothetical protein
LKTHCAPGPRAQDAQKASRKRSESSYVGHPRRTGLQQAESKPTDNASRLVASYVACTARPPGACNDAEACELTIRRIPLRAATGRSQASAPFSLGQAVELAGLVRPQGDAPAKPAASPAGGLVATTRAISAPAFAARNGPPSYLDTYEVTRPRQGHCAWRVR